MVSGPLQELSNKFRVVFRVFRRLERSREGLPEGGVSSLRGKRARQGRSRE